MNSEEKCGGAMLESECVCVVSVVDVVQQCVVADGGAELESAHRHAGSGAESRGDMKPPGCVIQDKLQKHTHAIAW